MDIKVMVDLAWEAHERLDWIKQQMMKGNLSYKDALRLENSIHDAKLSITWISAEITSKIKDHENKV